MFSQFTKRLQESLEAVEQSVAAAAGTVPPVSPSRTKSPAPGANNTTLRTGNAVVERELGSVLAPKRNNSSGSSLEERLRAKLVASLPPSAEVVSIIPPTPEERAIDTEIPLKDDPATIPLPLSPPISRIPSPAPSSPALASRQAESDPLSPNLGAFNTPRTTVLHGRNLSITSPKLIPSRTPSPPPSLQFLSQTAKASEVSVSDTPPLTSAPIFTQSPPRSITSPAEKSQHSVEISADLDALSSGLLEPADDVDRQQLLDRLKLVESRFTDVSSSFKRLQAERRAAEKVLREQSPLEGISDAEALQKFFLGLASTASATTEEIKSLNAQLRRQEDRMQELRDAHHLEGASRTAQLDALRASAAESESLLTAAAEQAASAAIDNERLQVELTHATKSAREEEEKRTKAISLLKTVRAKSVKIEKEIEEARDELTREKEAGEAKTEEIERLKKELKRAELEWRDASASIKTKYEREFAGLQSSYQTETATLKASHSQELATWNSRIIEAEQHAQSISEERDGLFDQLQLRQAEVESAQSHLQSLENQVTELKHLLRESNDSHSALAEDLAEAKRCMLDPDRLSAEPSSNSAQVSALVASTAEASRRSEAKLTDLRSRLATVEREHSDAEDNWSRTLALRSREVERLRGELAARDGLASSTTAQMEAHKAKLEREVIAVRDTGTRAAQELDRLKAALESAKDSEAAARSEQADTIQKLNSFGTYIEELRLREGQLRTANKTLREELKKVQNSAALLERQRNPGVGFWASTNQLRTNIPQDSSTSETYINGKEAPLRPASPVQSVFSDGDGNGTSKKAEEEVNLEYVRNIVLQFLEHPNMRADLVRVLEVVLRFNEKEKKRLLAKI